VLDGSGNEDYLARLLGDTATVSVHGGLTCLIFSADVQRERVVAKSVADVIVAVMLNSYLRNALDLLFWIAHALEWN